MSDFDQAKPAGQPDEAASTGQAAPMPQAPDTQPMYGAAPTGYYVPPRPGPRISTIVWGIIIALIGTVAVVLSLGLWVDIVLVVIIACLAAGLALLAGSLIGVARSRR
jgi:hypothetical protein